MWLRLRILMQFGVLYILKVSSLSFSLLFLELVYTFWKMNSTWLSTQPGLHWQVRIFIHVPVLQQAFTGVAPWDRRFWELQGTFTRVAVLMCSHFSLSVSGRRKVKYEIDRRAIMTSQFHLWHAQCSMATQWSDGMCVFFEARNWGSIGGFIHFLHHLLLHVWWHLGHLREHVLLLQQAHFSLNDSIKTSPQIHPVHWWCPSGLGSIHTSQ